MMTIQGVNGEDSDRNIHPTDLVSILRDIVICSIALMSELLVGVTTGAPTVIIPQLRREANSTSSNITDEMVSWASSASSWAAIVWVAILITMAHLFGRKTTMIFLNIFQFSAFLNFYCSTDITMVIVNQALLGVNQAGVITLFVMIISEFAIVQYRGLFLTFKVAGFLWGIWISNALGTYCHWTSIGMFGMVSSIYIMIAFITVPESPYWLARKGRYEDCASSHRWLKGDGDGAEKELSRIIASGIEREDEFNKDRVKNSCGTVECRYLRVIFKPEMYKPMFFCVLLHTMNEFSCKINLTIYAIDILKRITEDEQSAYTGMLILDGVTVFAMYLASILIKITKRKRLLLSASLLTIFLMTALSFYLFLVKYSVVVENVYVTMTILIIYSISVCCGPLIATCVTMGELLPVSSSLCVTIIATAIMFIKGTSIKGSFYIFKYLGNHGAFLFHVVGFSIVLILVYKYIPETKNKTLHEIADLFKRPNMSEIKESHEQDEVLMENVKV